MVLILLMCFFILRISRFRIGMVDCLEDMGEEESYIEIHSPENVHLANNFQIPSTDLLFGSWVSSQFSLPTVTSLLASDRSSLYPWVLLHSMWRQREDVLPVLKILGGSVAWRHLVACNFGFG